MIKLWLILKKFRSFFLFLPLLTGTLFLYFSSDNFHQRIALNTSNNIMGYMLQKKNQWNDYFKLSQINDSLLNENASLKNLLLENYYLDSGTYKIVDSIQKDLRFKYLGASVVGNSILNINNFITINKGSKHGVERSMAVVNRYSVIGIVLYSGKNFSVVQSVLNENTKISVKEKISNILGSVEWNSSLGFKKVLLKDIPRSSKIFKNEVIVTSGYGLYPPNIMVGKIDSIIDLPNNAFLEAILNLETKFQGLENVFVVVDKYRHEIDSLHRLVTK